MAKRLVVLGLAVLFCVVLVNAPKASGQAVFGNIIGTVTDPQGNAVVGAKVTVTSTTKSFAYDTTTNESGNYSVTHLIPDTYKVHIEATGFQVTEIPNVVLNADSAATVNAQLLVGAVTQTVEVTGDIPQLQTDRADVDVQFSQRYVEDLPVLNRNFTSFELLTPGTQKLPGFNHAATENPQGSGQIEVNGQHFSGVGYELDGTDNQDPILGIIVVNPNLDAITETKFAAQDYDVEAGKAIAGLITVQTKSGSNDIHGTGFFYYRNSDQQARDPFTNKPGVPLAPATWKQYGGSIGGPIIKNKLFFFGDYQGTHQIQGITNQYNVPSSEVDQTCNPATNAASATPGFCDLSQYLNAYGPPVGGVASGQIFNPSTGNSLTGGGRTPFANNMIPIADISQNIGSVLALFPTPTVTCPTPATASCLTNNYVATGSGPFNQYSFDTREDWSAPHGIQVFGRFSLDYFNLSGKGGLGALGSAGFGPGTLNGMSTNHDYNVAGGFTKTFGTNLLTDFRIGWFQYNPTTAYSDASQTPMTTFGFPGLNIPGQADTNGLSGFLFTNNGNNGGVNGALGNNGGGAYAFGNGLDAARCNCPLTEREHQIQFINNWTYIKGNHTFKFGADIRYATNLRVPSDESRSGLLYFDQLNTGNNGAFGLGISTFLLGDVSQFQRFVSSTTDAIGHQYRTFFYGQDSWRVNPKLTFTGGVRWEIYTPESVNGKGNGGFADLQEGVLRVAGYGGIGLNGDVQDTLHAFAPRLSLAYQFDSKTVLRMGYGRSFDLGVFGSNFGHAVTQNLPVLAAQNISDASLNAAAANNRSAVFNLGVGPPAYNFTTLLSDIGAGSPAGTLPLLGPDGTASPYIRPTIQRLPTVDEWNATVQRQLTPTLNLSVGYVANKGTHVFAGTGPSYNINQIAVGPGTDVVELGSGGAGFAPGFTGLQNPNDRRPFNLNGIPAFTYPGSTFVSNGQTFPTPPCCAVDLGNYFGNDASNEYESLQVSAEKRMSWGLQFLAHYTFSHSNGYDSTYNTINPRVAFGPNPYNRNQVFLWSAIYDLPIGRGKRFLSDAGRAMDLLVGGWQISNTTTYGTGLPFTPSIAECGLIEDAGPCRPNVTGKLATGVTHANGNTYWFTPVAPLAYPQAELNANIGVDSCTFARPVSGPLSLPACGQIGNMGFNSYWGPHAFYDDMSLTKTFNITERYKAQFRFDAYNLFNHPVLATPGNTCLDCLGNSSAGQITDIEADSAPGAPIGMRQLQFGVKFIF
ncbi:MAG TPA: TonB-dependent receptor [Verrucomicrobiae bacterium]|nr:TonB-dependent receptor [Verrucomicrobiae bacterium]